MYKCGEKWHENGKCKEEENIDKLFEEYSKKYNLKNCPYCHIVVIKNGGCNHITCKYCGKHWCWLCNEIFNSTEEHYGNINSKCYNQMMNNNNEIVRCDKCDTEINDNSFRTFLCHHIICNNCLIQYLLESSLMIIFPANIINCLVIGCKNIGYISGIQFVQLINNSNNEKFKRKYIISKLLFEYFINPIFALRSYFNILFDFYNLIINLFKCCKSYKIYDFLIIIGFFFRILFIPIFVLIPIFPIFVLKRLYYIIFLPEIGNQYKNKFLIISIVLAEEILTLVYMFSLFIIHYIFFILVMPIFIIVILIMGYNL